MFTERFMYFLTKHNNNSNNNYQIKQIKASYEIHNLFDHSLKATYAKLSRERSEVTKCIGVQVSQLIYQQSTKLHLHALSILVSWSSLLHGLATTFILLMSYFFL